MQADHAGWDKKPDTRKNLEDEDERGWNNFIAAMQHDHLNYIVYKRRSTIRRL